jgi:hypothetical protein
MLSPAVVTSASENTSADSLYAARTPASRSWLCRE